MKALIFMLSLIALAACQSNSSGAAKEPDEAAIQTGVSEKFTPQKAVDQKELMFVLADRTISKGDTVCMDVSVRDFTNILSMQYSMNWDPKVLQFVKIDKLNLKDLSANSFGLNRTEQGKIGTAWFDYDVKSITLSDGTPLYQVCFRAVGEPGAQSQVYFSSDPVVIEIANAAEQLVGFAFKRATITIQ
jgi:hypothetical protein